MRLNLALSEEQRDCYQELTNIAMGQAADKLARLLDAYVVLPVPKVSLIEISDLHMTMQGVQSEHSQSAVCQGFIGSGIAGEALLLFNEFSFSDLASVMGYRQEPDPNAELELLMDISSLLTGACIQGFGDQLGIRFNQNAPTILGLHCPVQELLKPGVTPWKKALAIEIHYSIEHLNINCDLLILFSEDSVLKLNKKINYLLD